MVWRLVGFEVANQLALGFFLLRSTFVNESDNGCQICPRHLYYQTNRGKVSEWSCGI
jgi:hypothetical protein